MGWPLLELYERFWNMKSLLNIKDERAVYDEIYYRYRKEKVGCNVSCADLDKARRSVEGAMRHFGISLRGVRALDVGCGLGYFSEALREQGADVSAVDSSPAAIEYVRERFPKITARVAFFPGDFDGKQKFDLIWACDFSLLNTFDVNFICREFVRPSLSLLTGRGALIIGWHSNLGGTMGSTNWAHWPLPMIDALKKAAGLVGPRVVIAPADFLSRSIIHASRLLRRSIPIYFFRRVGKKEVEAL